MRNLKIRPEVAALEKELIERRRDIHRHPELGFEVQRTAGIARDKLQALGLEVRTGVGKTGVLGILRGDHPGRTIALRADMDALPLQETTKVPYKSTIDGRAHACGHDGHTAMVLAAAEVLSKRKAELRGNLVFLFQPAEEGGGGANCMIQDGCLDGVDEIYGLHLWNYQPFGEVGISPGPIYAATDEFEITIKGKGGHGAAPQGTVDAVIVAAQLINALQTIVSRNVNPIESGVVTVGKINGGSNFNIIAQEVTMIGTARSFTPEIRRLIQTRMHEITAGVGSSMGAEIHLRYTEGYPSTINAVGPAQNVADAARLVVGEGLKAPYLSMGGEDFSYYAQKIPAAYFFVGSSPAGAEPLSVPHHCPHFDFDERALAVGASVLVQLAEDLLF